MGENPILRTTQGKLLKKKNFMRRIIQLTGTTEARGGGGECLRAYQVASFLTYN